MLKQFIPDTTISLALVRSCQFEGLSVTNTYRIGTLRSKTPGSTSI